MKTIIITLFVIFLSAKVSQSIETAKIIIDTANEYPGTIKKELYGAFWEFTMKKVNGPIGIYAQEIQNRGFDYQSATWGIAGFWYSAENNPNSQFSLKPGGFNENGVFSQLISDTGDDKFTGIAQTVYMEDNIAHEFYIYYRSDNIRNPLKLVISDSVSGDLLFNEDLPSPDSIWRKVTINLPAEIWPMKCKLAIVFDGDGSIEFDEASLMPENNVFGLRKEHYEMLKLWSPGMLRYPGGWMADAGFMRWYNMVGEIDKRSSPNLSNSYQSQRVDFGINNYMQLCLDLDITPQYTLNFGTAPATEAREIAEYINGDTNTTLGKLRKSHGFPDPYNIKYWEIGNEQYGEWSIGKRSTPKMASDFKIYCDSLRSVIPDAQTIIDGSFWGGYPFFDTVMSIAGSTCSYYGWHLDAHAKTELIQDDTAAYLSMVAASELSHNYTPNVYSWLKDKNLFPHTKQCNTEWYPVYDQVYNWHNHWRLNSLEPALWQVSILNDWRERAEYFEFSDRTINCGMFVEGFNNNTGDRIFAPTPSLYVMSMMRHYSGSKAILTEVECGTYNVPERPSIWIFKDVPWLNAGTTVSKDSLYLTVVNRHPSDSILTSLNINGVEMLDSARAVRYFLGSEDFLDCNTVEEPYKIVPQVDNIIPGRNYNFPPHSLTILAYSLDEIQKVDSIQNTANTYLLLSKNPFENEQKIWIKNLNSRNYQIVIYDITGRIVHQSGILSSPYFVWDARKMAKGSYYGIVVVDGFEKLRFRSVKY